MTISTAATGTPIQKPNGVFPFVDMQTGCLTEHGLRILSQYHNFIVGMNRITPCNATGTNTITLTPLSASPLIEKYVDFEVYSFVAANDVTGDVSITVAPKDGTLSTLNAYYPNLGTRATTGNIYGGYFYLAIYVDSANSGAGGFIIR